MDAGTYRRGAALAVLCTSAMMIVLDSTIVAIALPAIQRDLGFSEAGVAWVVNGYLVSFAGLLLLAGRLGDLLGGWRVFLAGIAVFTLASLLCGSARSAGLLGAGRFAQGAGGALAAAVVIGMIVRLYPAPGEQARAMGVYSFVQAGGAAIGFVVGGVLTDTVGWAWIFLINVPVGLVVGVAAQRVLPREAGVRAGGVDVPGALLITGGLSLGVYAIVQPGLAAGVGAVSLVGGFLVRQRYAARPLIALRVLTRPWLLRTNAVVMLVFAAGLGFQFLNTLNLQRVLGYDPLTTAAAFLPTPIMIGSMSLFVAPRVVARSGPRRVLIAGLTLLMIGLAWLGLAPEGPGSSAVAEGPAAGGGTAPAGLPYWTGMLPALLIVGAGVGVAVPAMIMLAMAGAEPDDTGMVSGLNNTAQQAGAALGLAVLAAVAAAVTGTPVTPATLHQGYGVAFLLTAAFVAGALLITVFALRRPPAAASPPTADVPAAAPSAIPSRVADTAGRRIAPAQPASSPGERSLTECPAG
jgi:MFS family permease